MPDAIVVTPWPDPVIDLLGHDPRSWYAETFWLPTLGPTCLLLLRHLADRFDRHPNGITLGVAETAAALGVGIRAPEKSPLMRSIVRLTQFELAVDDGAGTIAVRRNLPPVNRRHVRRLPVALQARHAEWVEAQLQAPPVEIARRRARRVAFTLVAAGDTIDEVERALHSAGFHPSICHEATRWAWTRHREAHDAAHGTAESATAVGRNAGDVGTRAG